jgi:predicted RNA polymerase sigma factor
LTDPLDHAFRGEWASVVATLARRLGDLQAGNEAFREELLRRHR